MQVFFSFSHMALRVAQTDECLMNAVSLWNNVDTVMRYHSVQQIESYPNIICQFFIHVLWSLMYNTLNEDWGHGKKLSGVSFGCFRVISSLGFMQGLRPKINVRFILGFYSSWLQNAFFILHFSSPYIWQIKPWIDQEYRLTYRRAVQVFLKFSPFNTIINVQIIFSKGNDYIYLR